MRLRFYLSPAGADPGRKYFDGLAGRDAAEVFASLRHLELHGLDGLVPCRLISGKVWELKLSRHRVFYVLISGPEMVLLHAYEKQGQKAPRREIEVAFARAREVLGQEPGGA